jgi:hypothetical protein
MTVSSTLNRKSYAGDGVTTSFSTSPVVFFDSTDLTVYAVVTATGVATTLTENTHYTVTGGSGAVGSISTAGGATPYGAPAAGYTLLIVRALPLTQEVDLQNNDASDAAVQEEAFDRGVMIDQQLDTLIDRSMRLPDTDVSGASTTLPTPAASKLLGWDSAGTALANYATATIVDSIVPTAFMETLLDDATAADARTTLGAAASGANTDLTSVYLNNTGLKVKDTNASHGLSIVPGSNITADRAFTIATGDADRTLTMAGDATISGTNSGDLASHSAITNSLGADVALNNTGSFFTGPTIAQGSTGTWFASGSVTVEDTAGNAAFNVKLWDGTTVIASGRAFSSGGAGYTIVVALSGYIASPAGNIRISVQDATSVSGQIRFNSSGASKDSTLSAFRVA